MSAELRKTKKYIATTGLFIIILSVFGLVILNVRDEFNQTAYSQPCFSNCPPTSLPKNGTQTWEDSLNNIKIQFSHLPQSPFIGNLTQLNFRITGATSDKPLNIKHISVTLIKNVTATLDNNASLSNKNNYVTFDTLTAKNGIVSLKYRFFDGGIHQIILKVETSEGKIGLAEFNIPVLRHWWDII
jgi:hypothetical protein